MMLYLNGQDIEHLTLGLFEREGEGAAWRVMPECFAVSSELFLEQIHTFLKKNALPPGLLQGVAITQGEGSSTALRAVYAIANTWAFVNSIPLFAIKKDERETDEAALLRSKLEAKEFLNPDYAHAPHITPAKRDALRRK
jgi:hypothetical protein